MKASKRKTFLGFTLIELLVVVFMIAVLAGIILTGLVAREKRAKDGRTISAMDQFRKTAKISYENQGNYAQVDCSTGDADIQLLCSDINKMTGSDPTIRRNSDDSGYCAYIQLALGHYWCVDSEMVCKDEGSSAPSATCIVGCDGTGTCKCEPW